MKQHEFISILKKNIEILPQSEQDEIIFDMNEHFGFALEEGKAEEAICRQLGNPQELALQYTGGRVQKTVMPDVSTFHNSRTQFGQIMKAILYAFLTLLLIGPVVGIYITLATLVVSGVVCVLSAFIALFGFFASLTTGITFMGVVGLVLGLVMVGVGLVWLNVFLLYRFNRLLEKLYRSVRKEFGGMNYVA